MKYNKEQIREIFGKQVFNNILKKILHNRHKGNLQKHDDHSETPLEPSANKQMNLSFSGRKKSKSSRKLSKPRQLDLGLNVKKTQPLKTYTDVDKFVKDNFVKNTYIGPDLSDFGFNLTNTPGFKLKPGTEVDEPYRDTMYVVPGPIMRQFNKAVKEKNKFDKEAAKEREERMKALTSSPPPLDSQQTDEEDISVSEITNIIQEIVEEELDEINHTTDSSGKTIIAQGAPGSVVRFATENPDIIKQMRDWIKDCQWQDLPDEAAVDELSDEEVLRGIQNNYDGGIRDFLRGSNSQAQVPVGYKESLKENWSSGQHDDAPDGYSNDYQRAFAHSQTTTPRENDTKKAVELAKQGKFVVLIEAPMYCKSTDACLGSNIGIHKVCNTRDEAEKEQEKFNNAESSDERVYIIGPDNVEPKQHKDEPSADDDVPFEEGVGYVYDKDMKKDPKHIPGERWRVKFNEGITKEVNEKPDYYKQLQMAQAKAYRQHNAEAVIYYADIMGSPSVASVSFERFKGSHLYDKWKEDNAERIALQQKRFTMPWLQEVTKSDLRGVIKELINEMWYGSKNDAEGDETHDEPLNEILDSYDKMIEFVKSLPPEEQKKLNEMAKTMGASAAVIKYLEDLAQQSPQ